MNKIKKAIEYFEHMLQCMRDEPPENITNSRDVKEWEDENNNIRETFETALELLTSIEKPPQIVEISEGDLVCIKTNLLLSPEVLKKVQADFVKQKESGVIVIDGNFEYKIIKAKKEDEA